MPSGITHILLSRKLQDEITDGPLKDILAAGSKFFTVGSVAPDLPYASLLDNDFILTTQGWLGDQFHYKKTNEVPLRSFVHLKSVIEKTKLRIFDRMFSFYIGYLSHVYADGIIHPFVRDKVGNYKQNKSAHRCLEMQLDVLYLEEITKYAGQAVELNYSNIHDELLGIESETGSNQTISLFKQIINDVYQKDYSIERIMGWVKGLHRLFAVAEGKHPRIYRNLRKNTFTYRNREDIDPEKALILTVPVDSESVKQNFLHTEKVHFLDHCVPKFFSRFKRVAEKAYQYVYENGPPLNESDIPAIDLDTGRLIDHKDLNEIPELWKLTKP
jgi:hypothetical protein